MYVKYDNFQKPWREEKSTFGLRVVRLNFV